MIVHPDVQKAHPGVEESVWAPPSKYLHKTRFVGQGISFMVSIVVFWNQGAADEVQAFQEAGPDKPVTLSDAIYMTFVLMSVSVMIFSLASAMMIAREDLPNFKRAVWITTVSQLFTIMLTANKFQDGSAIVTFLALTNITWPSVDAPLPKNKNADKDEIVENKTEEVNESFGKTKASIIPNLDELSFEVQAPNRISQPNSPGGHHTNTNRSSVGAQITESIVRKQKLFKKKRGNEVRFTMPQEMTSSRPILNNWNPTAPVHAIGDADETPRVFESRLEENGTSLFGTQNRDPTSQTGQKHRTGTRSSKPGVSTMPKPILKMQVESEHSDLEHEDEKYEESPAHGHNLLGLRGMRTETPNQRMENSRTNGDQLQMEPRSPITPIKVPSVESSKLEDIELRIGDRSSSIRVCTPSFKPGFGSPAAGNFKLGEKAQPIGELSGESDGMKEFSHEQQVEPVAITCLEEQAPDNQNPQGEPDEEDPVGTAYTVLELSPPVSIAKVVCCIMVAIFWQISIQIKVAAFIMCFDFGILLARICFVLKNRGSKPLHKNFCLVPDVSSNTKEVVGQARESDPMLVSARGTSKKQHRIPKVEMQENLVQEPHSLRNISVQNSKKPVASGNMNSFTAYHEKVTRNKNLYSRVSDHPKLTGIQNEVGQPWKKQVARDLSLEAVQASPRKQPKPMTLAKEKRLRKIRSFSSERHQKEANLEKKNSNKTYTGTQWKTQNLDDPHSDNEGKKVSVKDFSPRLLSTRQINKPVGIQHIVNPNSETNMQAETTKIQVLAAYFSMIDQLLLVSDAKMNILANNYSKHIFTKVVRRVENRFDVDILTDTEDCHRLTDVFTLVSDEELRCGRDTLENLSRMFRLFDYTKHKLAKKDFYQQTGILRILEVLEKLCRGVKLQDHSTESVGKFKKFKDFSQITNSLRSINLKNGFVTTCRFSIFEFMLLVQQYLEILSNSRLKNFVSDLNFTFIFMENVQLKIRLQPLQERYFVFVVFENITDKVALSDANSRLNFSVSLINSLSHEMFTPLHHMQWVIEGLHQKVSGDSSVLAAPNRISEAFKSEMISDILVIKQFGMGLSMFVQNILDFANIVNNTFELYYKRFKVKDLFEEILSIFSHKAKQKHITLEYEVDGSLEMVSDYNRLAGLIFNFTDNSMKFTQKGGITLKADLQDDTIVFRVVDTGVGIDEGDLRKICQFLNDPFLAEKTNDSAGIGIGLRMSQAILRQLTFGDTALFEIDSEKSQGTTIQFEIKQVKMTPHEHSNSSPKMNTLLIPSQQPFWQIQSPRFNMQMNALNLKEVQSDKVKTFIEERLKIHTLCKQIDEEDEDEADEPEQSASAGLQRKPSHQVEKIRQKLQRIHSIEEKFNSDEPAELDSASKIAGKSPSRGRHLLEGFVEKSSEAQKIQSNTSKIVDEMDKMGEFPGGASKINNPEFQSQQAINFENPATRKNKKSPEIRQVNSMEIVPAENNEINPLLVTPQDDNHQQKPTGRVQTTVRRKTTLDGIFNHKKPSMWNLGDLEIAEQIQTKTNAKRLISLSITHTPEHNVRHSVKLSDYTGSDRAADKPAPGDSKSLLSPAQKEGDTSHLISVMNRASSGSNKRIPPSKHPEKPPKKVALVVDDEIMNTEIAKDIIARFGLEVFTASNGDLALEICYKFLSKKKRIDVIFMDYSMPGMRGDQVTATLRDSRFLPILEGTPIIGLTAHNDSETKRKCLASGMNKVELKPFNVAKIKEILQEHKITEGHFGEESSVEIRKATELDGSPSGC